jgi:hypothetical protein
MRHKGFSEKWISWVKVVLSSGSSSILFNGIPGQPFKCKRGVRQCDPLSPLLFVLGADLLQSIINAEALLGNFRHPLGDNFGGDYPIIQYADDTLIVLSADLEQLQHMKSVLQTFVSSTSLRVNFNHCSWLSIWEVALHLPIFTFGYH